MSIEVVSQKEAEANDQTWPIEQQIQVVKPQELQIEKTCQTRSWITEPQSPLASLEHHQTTLQKSHDKEWPSTFTTSALALD
jgi:hypothetical protein